MFHQRARLGRGRIDYRSPLTEHPLNFQRACWYIALAGVSGGPVWWDLVNGNPGLLNWAASAGGWMPTNYLNGIGCLANYNSTPVSYLNLGAPPSLNITGDVTGIAWLRTSASTFYTWYSSFASSSPFNGFGFGIGEAGATGLLSFWNSNNGSWVSGGATINDYYWHHCAITFNGAKAVKFYKDGQLSGSASLATSGGIPAYSGNRYLFVNSALSTSFPGSIASFTLYPYVLSAEMILEDYYLSRQGYPGVIRRRSPVTYGLPSSSKKPQIWPYLDVDLGAGMMTMGM